ncbi:hypothetical protein QYM36_006731 [Artemia franciscana]|uniref:Protein kinase domain-containing protein n=1 Tax=Artemia franciscana TaxID=6661 RepID=A0AA88HY75_ARTSF|nr:hypothetical protein QYM36_006731 [Artemia franciscana]
MDPELGGFISKSDMNSQHAHCNLCKKDIRGSIYNVKRHIKSTFHKQNVQAMKCTVPVDQLVQTPEVQKKQLFDDSVKDAELRLAGWVAKEDISIRKTDSLLQVMKSCFPNDAVCQALASSRSKTTGIIKNVLATEEKVQLANWLRNNKFAIIVDEYTDKSWAKVLVIIAKFVDANYNVREDFLGLVDVHDASSAGQKNLIMKCLSDLGIPIQNLMGIGFDNASVNTGSVKGLGRCLKRNEEFNERVVDAHHLEIPVSNDNLGFSPPITSSASQSWFEGIFGCMRPVFGTFIGKGRVDDWEIPFESIKDLQWLGSGAQGAVFKGRLRGQVIAVKKVKDKQETEIRHLKQLNHPNIIRFLGICTQAPCYAVVMEYCSKGTLHEYLRKSEDTTPVQTLDWAVQIASGMSFLHSRNIIHRDLKSPNVLLSNDNKLKISDFGTSRVWSEASAEMSFIGTYAWMAPEIIRKEPCSDKVDVWSYGVVLWELVTGETPYRGLETARILFGVGNSSLSLPLPSTLPPGLQLLMKMCWETKPRNRPSFASIMAHLSIAAPELINRDEKTFNEERKAWRIEIAEKLRCLGFPGKSEKNASKELLKKRREEMKHVAEVRAHYDIKMACVNQLVLELTKIKLQLEEKDRELTRRERLLSMTLSSSGSPTARAMGRMSKKNNWRFGLKRRSAQDSSVGTPVDLVSRSSTLPARLEKVWKRKPVSNVILLLPTTNYSTMSTVAARSPSLA